MKPFLTLLMLIPLAMTCQAMDNTANKAITAAKPDMTLAQKEVWTDLLGKWYGKQPTTDGNIREELVQHLPGAYKDIFRVYDKSGHFKETVEVGLWGVAGPIYFSFFQGWLKDGQFIPADHRDPNNADAYTIISLDNDTFVYKNITTGNLFTLKKVADDFSLPNKKS